MLSTRLIAYLLVSMLLATVSIVRAQYLVPTPPIKARIQLGQCGKQVVHNLPAQRFNATAQAIAHAMGCFIH